MLPELNGNGTPRTVRVGVPTGSRNASHTVLCTMGRQGVAIDHADNAGHIVGIRARRRRGNFGFLGDHVQQCGEFVCLAGVIAALRFLRL